jgi:ankyrin repeat protein
MKILLLFFLLFLTSSCNDREKIVDKSKLLGYDYRLFQDTPAWNLAKAVEDEATVKIIAEVKKKGVNPDFQEPKFGNTLLMMAIQNGDYESVKTLLELGADPNKVDKYRGASAMIDAAKAESPKYLNLLLKYNGDPNAIETAPTRQGDNSRKTALVSSMSYLDDSSLKKVKLLVEAGADINYYNEGHTNLPLSNAIKFDKMDVALYLLKKGADYKRFMYKMSDGQEVYILEALRYNLYDLNSEKYKTKMEIVYFLKERGLDYWKEPIPERVQKEIKEKYPNDWQNYIKRY